MEFSGYDVTVSGINFNPTPEQVQKAKDFIWDYLEPHNRELIVNMATTDSLQKSGLITDKIIIGFEYK